jgi:hypothetical protein
MGGFLIFPLNVSRNNMPFFKQIIIHSLLFLISKNLIFLDFVLKGLSGYPRINAALVRFLFSLLHTFKIQRGVLGAELMERETSLKPFTPRPGESPRPLFLFL